METLDHRPGGEGSRVLVGCRAQGWQSLWDAAASLDSARGARLPPEATSCCHASCRALLDSLQQPQTLPLALSQDEAFSPVTGCRHSSGELAATPFFCHFEAD